MEKVCMKFYIERIKTIGNLSSHSSRETHRIGISCIQYQTDIGLNTAHRDYCDTYPLSIPLSD